jgi:hypothetical protein
MKPAIHPADESAEKQMSDFGHAATLVSQKITRRRSVGFIHWNASRVCMDIQCQCGQMTHIDGDFSYRIKCVNCARVYACDPHIRLRPLKSEPPDTLTTSRD